MRDVTEEIYRKKIFSENDFFWLKQIKLNTTDEELNLNMLRMI